MMNEMTHKLSATAEKCQRVNLIFHGLMAFVEKGDRYWVLIPNSAMHDFKMGDPEDDPRHPYSALKCLPTGQFYLTGIDGCQSISCSPPPRNSIQLQGLIVETSHEKARTVLSIPKPDVMRGFRAVETRDLDVATGDPTHLALTGRPDVVHTAIMFSYRQVIGSPISFVRVRDVAGNPVDLQDQQTFTIKDAPIANFGVYVNAKLDEIKKISTLSQSETAEHIAKHDEPFNEMFRVKSPTGACSPLRLTATVVGSKSDNGVTESVTDGPPAGTPPSVGVTQLELWTLTELQHLETSVRERETRAEDPKLGPFVLFNFTDPSGCTPIYIMENIS